MQIKSPNQAFVSEPGVMSCLQSMRPVRRVSLVRVGSLGGGARLAVAWVYCKLFP